MKNLKIPAGYQSVMPYLIINNAAGFLEFTKAVFNAMVKMKSFRDETNTVIAHAEVQIGDSIIMFAEATEEWGVQTAGLFIYVEDADDTYKKALAANAISVMEPINQSYGRSCGVKDPFGTTWWITSAI